jgi:hypothetical protein
MVSSNPDRYLENLNRTSNRFPIDCVIDAAAFFQRATTCRWLLIRRAHIDQHYRGRWRRENAIPDLVALVRPWALTFYMN